MYPAKSEPVSLAAACRRARLLYIYRTGSRSAVSALHSADCTELYYCVNGSGRFNLEDTLHTVEKDSFILLNAHLRREIIGGTAEYIVIGIGGVELAGEAGAYVADTAPAELAALPLRLLAETEQKPMAFDMIVQNLLEVLFVMLARVHPMVLQAGEPTRVSRECAMVKRYIEEHFAEDITLDILSEQVHVNKYYLVHTFKKEYHISPINYLIHRRIVESKYRLATTDVSLVQISRDMGFSSPSYFSQSFRRAEGISPNRYRRLVRIGQEPMPQK